MISNTIKALSASAVLAILIVALAAYYMQHQSVSVTTVQTSSETTATPPATATILFNYSSFNSITAQHAAALQQLDNVSTTYSVEADYPPHVQNGPRTVNHEDFEYNRSGNDTSLLSTYLLTTLNSTHALSMQSFSINGAQYFCSLLPAIGGNPINATCYNGGSTAPVFANLENYTYITDMRGMVPSFISQLPFSNRSVENASNYMGYNASYFHAELGSANSPIKGSVSIYSSSKYGIPLSYTILLNDPAYNSTNNTISISLKLTRLSTSVSPKSMMPQYLAEFIKSASK